jgi:hypothetical protein
MASTTKPTFAPRIMIPPSHANCALAMQTTH